MWKDIETAEDLLGYRFHAKLLKDIVWMITCCQHLLVYLVTGGMVKVV